MTKIIALIGWLSMAAFAATCMSLRAAIAAGVAAGALLWLEVRDLEKDPR